MSVTDAFVRVPVDAGGKQLRMAEVFLDDGTTAYMQIAVLADEHGRLVAVDPTATLLEAILFELRFIREILVG